MHPASRHSILPAGDSTASPGAGSASLLSWKEGEPSRADDDSHTNYLTPSVSYSTLDCTTARQLRLVDEAKPEPAAHFLESSSTFVTIAPIPSWMWWSAVSHMKAGVVTTLFFWST